MLYQHIVLESSLNLASGWKSHPVWEFCTALNHQNLASQECKNGTFYGVDIKKVAIANFASLSQIRPVLVCLVQILEHRVFRHLALNSVA